MPAHIAARFAVGDKPRRYKSDEDNPIFNGEISMSSLIIHRRGVEIEAFLPFISPFAETPESKNKITTQLFGSRAK
jgi:hypothetical protein